MSELVELGLRKPEAAPAAPGVHLASKTESADLKGVAGRLLQLMENSTLESDQVEAKSWKAEVSDLDQQLMDASHRQEILRIAAAALKAFKQHLDRSGKYYAGRERELTELISILREAVESAMGERASAFSAEVLSSVDKFTALGQLEDMRHLKSALSQEVSKLRDVTNKKKAEDERTFSELSQRVNELEDNLRLAKEEASVDSLTQISNRRAFDRAIKKLVAAADETGKPLTLTMMDVNKFKTINDTYGHPVGDSCLKYTAQALASAFRPEDVVARLGGDEFAVMLPGLDLQQTQERFSTLLGDLAERVYEYEAGGEVKKIRFSVSGGIAQFHPGESIEQFTQRADEGLYEAKKGKPGSVVAKKRSRLANLLRM